MTTCTAWVCTGSGEPLRADQLVTLAVADGNGYARSDSPPGTQVRICADLPGGTDGDFRTRYCLASCAAGDARALVASLLETGAAAARESESRSWPVYVYLDAPAAQSRPAWRSARELPDQWAQEASRALTA